MKILVVEDEKSVSNFIKKGLEEQAYVVDVAFDGQIAEQLAAQNQYDAILLDVVLPGMNGLELCKKIRRQKDVPILMLTALGSTNDIVTGLDAGADDYLAKPFKFQELLARIRALVRRKQNVPGDTVFKYGDLEINNKTKEVKRNGTIIKLTVREFYLLQYFVRNRGILVSRADIAENVWETSFDTGSNVVDVYVNYLRNKLDKNYQTKFIHTVYGMGYIFKLEGEE